MASKAKPRTVKGKGKRPRKDKQGRTKAQRGAVDRALLRDAKRNTPAGERARKRLAANKKRGRTYKRDPGGKFAKA